MLLGYREHLGKARGLALGCSPAQGAAGKPDPPVTAINGGVFCGRGPNGGTVGEPTLRDPIRKFDYSEIGGLTPWRCSGERGWKTRTLAVNLLLDPPIGDRQSVRQWAARRPTDPVAD